MAPLIPGPPRVGRNATFAAALGTTLATAPDSLSTPSGTALDSLGALDSLAQAARGQGRPVLDLLLILSGALLLALLFYRRSS